MTSVSVPHLLKPCTIYFPFGPQATFPRDGDEQNETASGHRVKVLSRPNGISTQGILTLSFSQVKSSKTTAFPPLTGAAGSDLSRQAQRLSGCAGGPGGVGVQLVSSQCYSVLMCNETQTPPSFLGD